MKRSALLGTALTRTIRTRRTAYVPIPDDRAREHSNTPSQAGLSQISGIRIAEVYRDCKNLQSEIAGAGDPSYGGRGGMEVRRPMDAGRPVARSRMSSPIANNATPRTENARLSRSGDEWPIFKITRPYSGHCLGAAGPASPGAPVVGSRAGSALGSVVSTKSSRSRGSGLLSQPKQGINKADIATSNVKARRMSASFLKTD
jgi:hypothetical protein